MAPIPAKTLAQTILDDLGSNYVLPNPDLTGPNYDMPDLSGYTQPDPLTIEDLTVGVVGGSGAFDKLMTTQKVHLKEEYEKGRISGDQYAKAYIALTSGAMTGALQFLLSSEQTYWQGVLAQAQAKRAEIDLVTASVGLETAKAQLTIATYQATLLEAQYVQTLMATANEDAKYELTYVQMDMVREQIKGQVAQTDVTKEQLETHRAQTLDTRSDGITPIAGVMGKQKELTTRQIEMVREQTEAQRGQTMDTRTDNVTLISGVLQKQKDLYTQQIDSYEKDSQHKAAKMFLDSWTVQKTVDEGFPGGAEQTQTILDTVLAKIRTSNNLT